MPEQQSPTLKHLLEMAARYSGAQADSTDRLYADLDIGGGDFLEFIVEVERHFGVDLSEISPRHGYGEAQDPTLQALAEIITKQRG